MFYFYRFCFQQKNGGQTFKSIYLKTLKTELIGSFLGASYIHHVHIVGILLFKADLSSLYTEFLKKRLENRLKSETKSGTFGTKEGC